MIEHRMMPGALGSGGDPLVRLATAVALEVLEAVPPQAACGVTVARLRRAFAALVVDEGDRLAYRREAERYLAAYRRRPAAADEVAR